MSSGIEELLAVLANHPDHDGNQLTTSDLPEFIVERAWHALEDSGDDLTRVAGAPCRGLNRPGECTVLIVNGDDGWTVSYRGSQSSDVGWRYQTPPEIERALRMAVGNRPADLAALRDALEDVWEERHREVAMRNSERSDGQYERVPRRMDDDVVAEALMRYRKGGRRPSSIERRRS